MLNKAHVKYLENNFYNLALKSGGANITNNTIPTRSSVSEYDEAMLLEFIENTKLLVNSLGYKVFEIFDNDNAKISTNEPNYFYINAARGANAKGALVSDGFVVLKDSIISSTSVQSMPSSLLKLRDNLFDKKIIDSDFKFTRDYVFTSPSLAASIIMGRSANGRTELKTKAHKTIKEIEEN